MIDNYFNKLWPPPILYPKFVHPTFIFIKIFSFPITPQKKHPPSSSPKKTLYSQNKSFI